MLVVPKRRIWTRQPNGPVEVDPRWRISAAAVPRAGAMLEPVSGRIITPSGAASYVATDIGHAITGSAYYDIPTTLFKINKAWSLLLVLKNKNSNTGAVQAAISNPGYNSANGDSLSVGLPDYTSFNRLDINNRGNYAGASAVKTTNPSMEMLRWSTFLWSHPASAAGSFHTPKGGATSISAASPFGAGSNVMRVTATHLTFEVALVALIDDVLPASAYPELAANPWQIFRPRTRRIFFDLGAGGTNLNAAAAGQAQASGAAQLDAQVALAGIDVAVASGQATAAVAVPLAAAGISIAEGTAGAQATVTVSAAGLAQAAGTAGLSASILLAGAGAAQTAGNAQLAVHLQAMAAGAAEAAGSANLNGAAEAGISATGAAQASGNAVLHITVQLQAAGNASAAGSAAGQLAGEGSLLASGAAQATGTATPTLRVNLAGAGQAAAAGTANANLSAADQITAIGSAQAGGSAAITVTATLTAAGFVAAMGAGALAVELPLAALGQAQAAGTANLINLPDYIPVGPLRLTAAAERPARLAAGIERPTRLAAGCQRPITLRHEVTRAYQ